MEPSWLSCLLTSWIQSLKAETRVNTVGFLRVLQPKAETKLVTPWTCQEPSAAGQLRGPPESPWNGREQGEGVLSHV